MDAGIAARIARLAVDEPGRRVLEVGPGTGALTTALVAAGADVTAIDLDPKLVEIARARPDLASARIEVADATTFDYDGYAGEALWHLAGNLPYNVATPTVVRAVGLAHPPRTIVVMVQRDVALRFGASPSTEAYGSLSIHVQRHYTVERAFDVAPEKFYPRPGVTSSIVVLRRRETPLVDVRDDARFEEVVRGAFAYRRKTLANSLALSLDLPRENVARAIAVLGIDADVRGEALDIRQFAALADALAR